MLLSCDVPSHMPLGYRNHTRMGVASERLLRFGFKSHVHRHDVKDIQQTRTLLLCKFLLGGITHHVEPRRETMCAGWMRVDREHTLVAFINIGSVHQKPDFI